MAHLFPCLLKIPVLRHIGPEGVTDRVPRKLPVGIINTGLVDEFAEVVVQRLRVVSVILAVEPESIRTVVFRTGLPFLQPEIECVGGFVAESNLPLFPVFHGIAVLRGVLFGDTQHLGSRLVPSGLGTLYLAWTDARVKRDHHDRDELPGLVLVLPVLHSDLFFLLAEPLGEKRLFATPLLWREIIIFRHTSVGRGSFPELYSLLAGEGIELDVLGLGECDTGIPRVIVPVRVPLKQLLKGIHELPLAVCGVWLASARRELVLVQCFDEGVGVVGRDRGDESVSLVLPDPAVDLVQPASIVRLALFREGAIALAGVLGCEPFDETLPFFLVE